MKSYKDIIKSYDNLGGNNLRPANIKKTTTLLKG